MKESTSIRAGAAIFSSMVMLLTAMPAYSAASSRWSVLAGAGVSLPSGSGPAEGLTAGATATAGVGARFGSAEFVGRMVYTGFRRNDDGVMAQTGLASRPVRLVEMTGGQMTTYDAGADLRYYPTQSHVSGVVHPFILCAAGVSSQRYEPVEILYQYAGHTWPQSVDGEQGTYARFGIGAGLRMDVAGRWALALEGRYEQTLRAGADLRSMPLRLELIVTL